MKKVVKFFVLSISVIALFGCKKEGQAKTGSAMNEIYGYWLVFDTSDRREKRDDIDYSTHFTKEENDSNIKKDSDTVADYSKKNMNNEKNERVLPLIKSDDSESETRVRK